MSQVESSHFYQQCESARKGATAKLKLHATRIFISILTFTLVTFSSFTLRFVNRPLGSSLASLPLVLLRGVSHLDHLLLNVVDLFLVLKVDYLTL